MKSTIAHTVKNLGSLNIITVKSLLANSLFSATNVESVFFLDIEIAPCLVVYGHCALDPKTPCPINLFPKCYGCSSFCPSTGKLPLYERQYQGEQKRLAEAETAGAELALEEAKATIKAMDKWLPELRRLADG